MRKIFTSYIALTTTLFALQSLLEPTFAQSYTQADIDRICGTKMEIKSSGGGVEGYKRLDKEVQAENAKIDACIQGLLNAEAMREAEDKIPVGGIYPGASVNGVPLRKCSHGGVCYGQMLDAMRKGIGY